MAPKKPTTKEAKGPKSGPSAIPAKGQYIFPEAFQPLPTYFQNKIRNLEKRKAKMDAYKIKQKDGRELEKNEMESLAGYDECVTTLHYYTQIYQDVFPLMKEVSTTWTDEVSTLTKNHETSQAYLLRSVLDFQDLLENLDEDVRMNFTHDSSNPHITEEQFDAIDKFYANSAPRRSNTDGLKTAERYSKELNMSYETWRKLFAKKTNSVPGASVSYSIVHDILAQLTKSDVFDGSVVRAKSYAKAPEPVTVPEDFNSVPIGKENESFDLVNREAPIADKPGQILGEFQNSKLNFIQDDFDNGQFQDSAVIEAQPKVITNSTGAFAEFESTAFSNDRINDSHHVSTSIFANGNGKVDHHDMGLPTSDFSNMPTANWADEAPDSFDNGNHGDNFTTVGRGNQRTATKDIRGAPRGDGFQQRGGGFRGEYHRGGNRGSGPPYNNSGSYRGAFQQGGNRGGRDDNRGGARFQRNDSYRGQGSNRGYRAPRGGYDQRSAAPNV